MGKGYFIAQKTPDGSPGRPIAADEFVKDGSGPFLLFEDLDEAKMVRDQLASQIGPLSIFCVNIVLSGELVC